MNRVLKRPMFKMGGSSGTGITSGLDRQNYQIGGGADARRFGLRPMPRVGGGADARRFLPNRMMQMASPMNTNQSIAAAAPTLSTRERLTQALGAGSNRNLSQFLTQFGLNLLSQSPTGNIFQTAATAAQEPTKGLFDDLNREQDLKRQIALEAERLDIGQEQARELQLLKNLNDDDRNAIEQEIQARMTDLGETREEASRIVLDKRAYGVLDQPGEVRQKAIDERSAIIQDQERLSKPAADKKASYEVDFSKIQKDNEEYDFDLMNPFWDPQRKNYQEGSVYIDYVTGKAFRRDSTQTQNTPIGFVEVPLK
jgi:hypothetical protein